MSTATVAADDPKPPCTNPLLSTVWYSFTPSQNVPLALDTFGSSVSFSSIAVYAGSRGALSLVGCSSLGTNSFGLQAVAGTIIDTNESVNTASGMATVSGTATCDQTATASISGTLRQRLTRFLVVTGTFSLDTPCSPGGSPWSAKVVGDNGPFGGGRARVDATATACVDGIVCTSRSASQTVGLHGGH